MSDKEEADFFDFDTGAVQWMTLDGKFFFEEADYSAGGMKWRVHKYDADPFPSTPHAHCIDGPDRFKGSKLHFGTGIIFSGKNPLRKMSDWDFQALVEKVRKKFPGVELPIPISN